MKSLAFKVALSAMAVVLHLLGAAAAWEFLNPGTRYEPDGLFTLGLLVPAFIAIWSRGIGASIRVLGWALGVVLFLVAFWLARTLTLPFPALIGTLAGGGAVFVVSLWLSLLGKRVHR